MTNEDYDDDVSIRFITDALGGHITESPAKPRRANAEIKRLLCMAHETYDPAALDALTRALIAQGFGK